MNYQIFTDATADMSESMLFGWPSVQIIPMQVNIGEHEYRYGPGGDITIDEFYRKQRRGQFAMTSQASPETCFSLFEPVLRAGKDILYLGFSSAMSGMYQVANLCAEELRVQYPERAEELKDQVKFRFPDADIHIADIGPIIGAHTGPGMLALIFWGTTR